MPHPMRHVTARRLDLDQCRTVPPWARSRRAVRRARPRPGPCVARAGVEHECAEHEMDIEPSDLIVGLMMLAFGVVGLILAAGAVDDEMYVFGLSLFAFACLFIIGQIRHHFDRRDAALVAARAEGNPNG